MSTIRSYSIKYVIMEKKVPVCYITAACQYETPKMMINTLCIRTDIF